MGAFCCCLCPEDFEEHAYTSNPIYRQCICLRYFFHQLLNGVMSYSSVYYTSLKQGLQFRPVPPGTGGTYRYADRPLPGVYNQVLSSLQYGAMFQRLDGRSVPSQIQTATSSASSIAGNTYDNSLCENHHLVPRLPPYEADPRYAREGLISRREKSMSHIQEDLQTLRRNGSSSAVETLAAVRKRIAETEVGQKLTHAESEKNLAAKTRDTGFVFTTSEDEDVCPTCLE
ncbi:hypothetical protein GW17_00003460, partial [Ensete ventricosum]